MKRRLVVLLLGAATGVAGELSSVENAVAGAARTTRESVVTVLAVKKRPFDVTGVVVARGIVLTVREPFLDGAHTVPTVKVRFHANGATVEADVIDDDAATNTMLIKTKGGKARTIKPRLDDDIHLGKWTLMVGNTFHSGRESDPVVSLGVVSGLERGSKGLKAFHTSTLVNPGAFGAPIVDLDGGLLGIMNTRITAAGGQSIVIPYERIFLAYKAKKGAGARALGTRPYKGTGGTGLHSLMGLVVEQAARRGSGALVAVRSGDPVDAPADPKPEEKKTAEKKEKMPGKAKKPPRPPPVPPRVQGARKAFDRSSGVIVGADGLILCPLRVTGWPGPLRKLFIDMPNGPIRVATRLGYDERIRIALLKIDAKDLPVLPVAPAASLMTGQFVVALGYPHGNPDGGSPQLTLGVLSRQDALGGIHPAFRALQTDAGVAGGNRGGPLLDLEGRLLGVLLDVNDTERTGYESARYRGRYVGNAGLGFAVPVSVFEELLPRLRKGEVLKRVVLGVRLAPVPEGLKIVSLTPRKPPWPAEAAGLRKDDVIVSVSGHAVKTLMDLQRALARFNAGETVDIEYLRAGKPATAKLTLAERPLPAPRK